MNIGFIGTGNMAGAMISGLVNYGYNPEQIHIMNRTYEKALNFAKDGVNVYKTADEVIAKADIIILGIKPNHYFEWLNTYDISSKLLISIAAGIKSSDLEKYTNKYIISMPNTPAIVGKGTTLLVESPHLNDNVLTIFKSLGTYQIIKEEQLPAYTLVTGCSPAYYFTFVDNLSSQLASQFDLDKDVVEKLLIDVLVGSSEMLQGDLNAKTLTENVCSPGGVTVQVINELNKELPKTLELGFTKAIKRNDELSK